MTEKAKEPRELYGTAAAADCLGLSRAAVKYHIRAGTLRGELIGRSMVFRRDELDRFQRERRSPGRPPKRKSGGR